MTVQTVSGALNSKKLAAYLNKSHKSTGIRVHRSSDGYLLLTDHSIIIQAFVTHELSLWTPVGEGAWFYPQGEFKPHETDSHFVEGWHNFHKKAVIAQLAATRYLYEQPQWKGSSTFYRKMIYTQDTEEKHVWIDKAFLDLVSTDPDNLDGSIFELLEGDNMVRVSVCSGIAAYFMTASIEKC